MAKTFYTSWAKVPGNSAQKKWAAIQAFALANGLEAKNLLLGLLVYDKEALSLTTEFSQTGDDHEIEVILRAKYYTTVRRRGRGQANDVRRFTIFRDAVADAEHDPRALVYGVVTDVNSTCLSRPHWEFYKLLIEVRALREQ